MIKDIEEFEGDYQISTTGEVYSIKFGKRRLLKPRKNNKGYLQVGLYKDGKQKRFSVHRLVAESFIPNTENLPFINHINEIKTDNRVENLEWVTAKENINYGTVKERISDSLKGRKMTDEYKMKMSKSVPHKSVNQYTLDGLLIASYSSIREAYRQTGYNVGNISSCCRGKYKQAYGYLWKYAE